MAKRVAVVLAGCGVFDGSEIHEASAVLVQLSREGAQVRADPCPGVLLGILVPGSCPGSFSRDATPLLFPLSCPLSRDPAPLLVPALLLDLSPCCLCDESPKAKQRCLEMVWRTPCPAVLDGAMGSGYSVPPLSKRLP